MSAFGQAQGLQDSPWAAQRAGERPAWATDSAAIPSAEYRSVEAAQSEQPIRRYAPRQTSRGDHTVSVQRLKNAPPPKAVREMTKGAEAVAAGDREEAIRRYEKAIEIHPNYVEAYNNLGVQNLKLERIDKAIAALEKAVELDPQSAEPHLNLSVALHCAGQLDAAEYQAERAVELAPRSTAANLGLGLVLTSKGKDLEEAVERLTFAAEEHPGAMLAAAEALLQLDRPKDAHAALRYYLHQSPKAVQ
ncbi:MAG: tetratricopeptide repeat protein [Acidobacteria bacterium]|nr:tetratricopeptide repeat protein [Acidobacteriota bacterium]